MAYARMTLGDFGRSDVYVFATDGTFTAEGDGSGTALVCLNCGLTVVDGMETDATKAKDGSGNHFTTRSSAVMVAHLQEHTARGQIVPEGTLEEILADDAENFPPLA